MNGPKVVFLTLFGEYDIARAVDLRRQLEQAQDADIALIDVHDVTYMDSTALTALLRLRKRMEWNNGHGIIRLVGAPRNLRRIFEIANLDRVFEIHDHVRDAAGTLGYLRCIEAPAGFEIRPIASNIE